MIPRVTVVIASFSSTARNALESLDRQSLRASEFEIVIVPDDPDPKNRERMTQLVDNRPNVRLQAGEAARTLGARRNAGASAAAGEYLLFLDDGFTLGDQALERLCNFADEHDADICFGKTSRKGTRSGAATALVANQPTVPKEVAVLLDLDTAKIFRRTFLEKFGNRFSDDSNQRLDIAFDLDAISGAGTTSALGDYPAFIASKETAPSADVEYHFKGVSNSSAPEELRELARLQIYRHHLGLLLSAPRRRLDGSSDADLAAHRDVVKARVPITVDEQLEGSHRALATALREGGPDAAAKVIDSEKVRLRLRHVAATWEHGAMKLEFEVRTRSTDTATIGQSPQIRLALCVFRPSDGTEWRVPDKDVVVTADSDSGGIQVTGTIRPGTLAGGMPLPEGNWIPAICIAKEGLDRRQRIPFSRALAGASYAVERAIVSFNDGGRLALDVGATSKPVVSRLTPDLAQVSENHRGSVLRVELPNLDFPNDAEMGGRLRIGRLPVPATIRTEGGIPVLEALVSGMAGTYPLATKFSAAPYTSTGLALEIDGLGGMTTGLVNRRPRKKGTRSDGRSHTSTFPVRSSSTRFRQAVKRMPGAATIYRRLRGVVQR